MKPGLHRGLVYGLALCVPFWAVIVGGIVALT